MTVGRIQQRQGSWTHRWSTHMAPEDRGRARTQNVGRKHGLRWEESPPHASVKRELKVCNSHCKKMEGWMDPFVVIRYEFTMMFLCLIASLLFCFLLFCFLAVHTVTWIWNQMFGFIQGLGEMNRRGAKSYGNHTLRRIHWLRMSISEEWPLGVCKRSQK